MKVNSRQLLTLKMGMIYYWPFLPNFALFGIIWMFCPKNFSHSLFVKEHNLFIRIKKRLKTWIFEIHYFITWWRARWVSKIHVFQFFSIPIENLCLLTKIEWEKCSIFHFLYKTHKLFQIRRNWAKKVNNKLYPFWVSKVA